MCLARGDRQCASNVTGSGRRKARLLAHALRSVGPNFARRSTVPQRGQRLASTRRSWSTRYERCMRKATPSPRYRRGYGGSRSTTSSSDTGSRLVHESHETSEVRTTLHGSAMPLGTKRCTSGSTTNAAPRITARSATHAVPAGTSGRTSPATTKTLTTTSACAFSAIGGLTQHGAGRPVCVPRPLGGDALCLRL